MHSRLHSWGAHPGSQALLALWFGGLALVAAPGAFEQLAQFVLRPAPDHSLWLARIMTGVDVVWGHLLCLAGGSVAAVLARALGGRADRAATSTRLLLWLVLVLLFASLRYAGGHTAFLVQQLAAVALASYGAFVHGSRAVSLWHSASEEPRRVSAAGA